VIHPYLLEDTHEKFTYQAAVSTRAMRLLQFNSNGELSLTKNFVRDIPPYAILSHTWGSDEDEVTFQEMSEGSGKDKAGYKKVFNCGKVAADNNIHYFWADTCCIDKTSSAELSEAINSMFNWYRDAKICYVYLSDVEHKLDESRWFKRGWTLQELLAPRDMVFFNREWKRIDTRLNLSYTIFRITKIPHRILARDFSGECSVAQLMSWAAERETTREEDIAYCLLGLLGVNMPLLYGEGSRAFERLQQEFIKMSTDHSLFCWQSFGEEERGPFARSPAEFRGGRYMTTGTGHPREFWMTNRGLHINLPLRNMGNGEFAAILDCFQFNQRFGIFLKEVHHQVYRRVRCSELFFLRHHPDSATLGPPTPIYIEPAVQRTLGRDSSQIYEYSFLVNFSGPVQHGFKYAGEIVSRDTYRSSLDSDTGHRHLQLGYSGMYFGLLLHNPSTEEAVCTIIGVHNTRPWSDTTKVAPNENLQSINDKYYHREKEHGPKDEDCWCRMPGKRTTSLPLSHGKTLFVGIGDDGTMNHFNVYIDIESEQPYNM
jgi:hypothetical protein